MKQIFLVSLVGYGVAGKRFIIGFLSSNKKEIIATYIKNKFNLILDEELMNQFNWQIGHHWEYSTNRFDVDVHVDICYNLNENENK